MLGDASTRTYCTGHGRGQRVNTGRQPIRRGGSTNLKIRDVKFDLAVQKTEPLPRLPTGGRADVALYFPAVRPVLSGRRALVTVTRSINLVSISREIRWSQFSARKARS